MDRDKIHAAVVAALRRSGLNPYRAAVGAGLPADAIRHMLAGHEPRASRLAQICAAIGLEFYVGPPRAGADVSNAITLPPASLRDLETSAQTLNRVVAEAGRNPVPDDLWPVLAERMGVQPQAPDEQGAGVPVGSQPIEVMQLLPASEHDTEVTDDPHSGRLWFSREWLERRGFDPTRCAMMRVRDESMGPTLPKDCLLLVDLTRTDWLHERIFVVRTNGDLVAKRAAFSDSGQRLLLCDHPAWPDTVLPHDAEILGQVRWMACGMD